MTRRGGAWDRRAAGVLLRALLTTLALTGSALVLPGAPGSGGLVEQHEAVAGTVQARTVYLEVTVDTGIVQQCSGTLIGPLTVATAGHCLRGVSGARHPTSILVVPGQHYLPDGTRVRPFGRCSARLWAAPPQGGGALDPDDYGAVQVHRCLDVDGEPVHRDIGRRTGWSDVARAPDPWPTSAGVYVGYPNTGVVHPVTGRRIAGMYRSGGYLLGAPDGSLRGRRGIPAGGSGGGLHLDLGDAEPRLVAVLSGRVRRELPRLDESVYRPVTPEVHDFLRAARRGDFDALPGGATTSLAP